MPGGLETPVTEHSETVRTERRGEIGVIVVDNPPVNAIAPSVRDGIYAAVQELGADAAVRAVVLHCAGSTFMAGADIRRLGGRTDGPHLGGDHRLTRGHA